MTKEKTILSKLQFELKTTNVTLRCGLVVFSRAWLKGSAGKPVHTIPSISSGVNLVWSFCSTTYNGDDKHVSLFWICCDFAERPRVDRAYLLCCWFLNFISSQSIIVLKYALVGLAVNTYFLRVYVLWTKFWIYLCIVYLAKTHDSSSPHIPKL